MEAKGALPLAQATPSIDGLGTGKPKGDKQEKELPVVTANPSQEALGGEKKEKKKERKKPKRDVMVEGEICKSGQFTWKVISILGGGGFGDVYKVVKENDPDQKEYAMKTEMVIGDKHMLRLKIEVESLIRANESKNKKHFLKCVDRGKTDKFKFMVMSLVGTSLEDYRKKYDTDFTPSTAMQIGVQTIEALRDFHQIGWLHRDIKPQNFAHGLGENLSIIYILDFGIAKRIFDKKGNVKTPRYNVKFLGTMRFASRACHHLFEQGRKDDYETWIYLIFDIFDRKKGLPWKKDSDKHLVISKKEKFCTDKKWFDEQYSSTPVLLDFHLFLYHLGPLAYEDAPEYDLIKVHFNQTAKKRNIDMALPLDWTNPPPEVKEKNPEKGEKEDSVGAKQEGSVDRDGEEKDGVKKISAVK